MGSIHLDIGYCSRSWKKLEILNVKELYILYERERIYISWSICNTKRAKTFSSLCSIRILVLQINPPTYDCNHIFHCIKTIVAVLGFP